MSLLTFVLYLFIVLESFNIIALYFFPEFKKANGVGVFNAWEESKKYPEIHNFVKYLVYWVAGTKAIFISLLIVILVLGDQTLRIFATIALILSIGLFYWKMFPLIQKMDINNELTPKKYSKTIGFMIGGIIFVLLMAIIVQFSAL